MKVEIWSDVVCPWCYIGKRRFEAALAGFAHRSAVEVVWRSFQLDPDAPADDTRPVNAVLAQKYGVSLHEAAAMSAQVSALAAADGLEYHLDQAQRSNTFAAHRLIHWAATQGCQDAMKERLLRAYFTEGAAVGDLDTLVALAAEVGLPAAEARTVLAGTAYSAEVRADEQRAQALGIRGVPFFVLDDTYAVSGAQSAAVFEQALEQAWAATHPLVMLGQSPTDEAALCGPDGCALPARLS
ncbi:MAG: DsbA family oxidoreductase [Chloroflexota bacterium]|nr:DsbA family oxidoreductase [Chloroflexota bacterium]